MVGGVTQEDHKVAEDNFTEDQWVSLYTLVQDMMGEYPMAKVIGHNEVSSKFCPSFDVQAWLINNGLIDGKDNSENKSED
jgi:N-acetyl-anhydromuramyl-L-alanine amidase AmpD